MNLRLKCVEAATNEAFTTNKTYKIKCVRKCKGGIYTIVQDDNNDSKLVILIKELNGKSNAWQSKFRLQLIPVVR